MFGIVAASRAQVELKGSATRINSNPGFGVLRYTLLIC